MSMIREGQIVRFANVVDPGDDMARYVALEDSDGTLLIRYIGKMEANGFVRTWLAIPPVYRCEASEIVACEVEACAC